MGSLREFTRTRIPLSTEFYELLRMRRGMSGTRSRVEKLLASGEPIKLDIGGGEAGKNGWSTIDITDSCDLFWDLRKGIPFPDASVDVVYSSHFFEHLTYPEGQWILKESLRVLKSGGVFSICVPNARMYIEAYLASLHLGDEVFSWKPAYNSTTSIDAINYVAYMAGEHKYMFDQENLLHLLSAAGFSQVRQREFDPSCDRAERDFESIYAQGIKP